MENITKIRCGSMPENSATIKPFRMYYVQNDSEKNWDLALVNDTVAAVIYNKSTDKLVFVKQFRPMTYYDSIKKLGCNFECKDDIDMVKYPAALGICLDLCSKTVDRDLPIKEIVRMEIERVCGYKVSLDKIEELMSYRSDVGASGAEETLFYCEVTNGDKVSNTDPSTADNLTEILEMSIDDAKGLVTKTMNYHCRPICLIGILWFLRNKAAR